MIISIKGHDHLIEKFNNEYYALILKLNVDNSDFYYNSTLWENMNELNQNDFSFVSNLNSKYWGYSNFPITDLMVEINSVQQFFSLIASQQGKTMLQIQQKAWDNYTYSQYVVTKGWMGKTISPWNFPRGSSEWVTTSDLVFKGHQWDYEWVRIGVCVNQDTTWDDSGSAEGIGIRGGSPSGPYNYSSGTINWLYNQYFSKARVWVKIDLHSKQILQENNILNTLLQKDNKKYFKQI